MTQIKIFVSLSIDEMKQHDIYRKDLDFDFTQSYEPLIAGITCSNETWNGSCGCARAFSGIHSLKSTTAFLVTPVNPDALRQNRYCQEWKIPFDMLIEEMQKMAQGFEVNDIVQYVGENTLEKVGEMK